MVTNARFVGYPRYVAAVLLCAMVATLMYLYRSGYGLQTTQKYRDPKISPLGPNSRGLYGENITSSVGTDKNKAEQDKLLRQLEEALRIKESRIAQLSEENARLKETGVREEQTQTELVTKPTTSASYQTHPIFPIPSWNTHTCQDNRNLWNCVGADREWSVAFVDQRPGPTRGEHILRMAKRSELVVTHDTEVEGFYNWPISWTKTKRSNNPSWEGRRVFTDKTNRVWASVIQGDLDKDGAIFDNVVKMHQSRQINDIYDKYNKDNSGYGTHIRLLASSALATRGDILEMGTGFFSTPMFHEIVENGKDHRMIISAETDSSWVMKFQQYKNHFHQFVLVPVYSNGIWCPSSEGHSAPTPDKLAWAGEPRSDLDSIFDVSCTDNTIKVKN